MEEVVVDVGLGAGLFEIVEVMTVTLVMSSVLDGVTVMVVASGFEDVSTDVVEVMMDEVGEVVTIEEEEEVVGGIEVEVAIVEVAIEVVGDVVI